MNNLSLLTFLCSCFGIITSAEGYVQNRSQADGPVHWADAVSFIDIYVNPSNTQGFSTSEVHSQVSNSLSQWNGNSRITLRKNNSTGTAQPGLNEIYFSSDPSLFNGTGVVGLTQVIFKNNTGEILEADILLNDNYTFTSNINELSYLGNVITHELGHFAGLGHSQVEGSTMFYALTRGQSMLADDDKAGIYSIYPTGSPAKGALSGKIVGGNSLAKVFGAHVQALSLKSGKIAGSSISEIDGSFLINGLDKDDQYYIYTSPTAQIGLPDRYSTARYDFCASSKKYRGSFFQSCGSSSEGFPQAVKLNSAQVDVGNITIRCALDVPVNYMLNKSVTPALFDIQSIVTSGVGNSFTGFFSSQEIASPGVVDYFRMDLSNIDWNSIASSGDLYVEFKIVNQSLQSPFKANISIKRNSSTVNVSPKYLVEDDGKLNLETVKRIAINRALSSDNDFEVSITPETLNAPTMPSGLPLTKADYFPASSYFEDSFYFYLVTASVVRDNGNGTYSLVSSKNVQLSDNTHCPDAINTYALSNFSAKRAVASSSSKKKNDGIACGTVDLEGGRGGGPGGFFIGLILSLLLCGLTSSIIKHIKSKHYSKLA